MGDAHRQSHRRSLIVSSTISSDSHKKPEGQELSIANYNNSSNSDSITTNASSPAMMYSTGPAIGALPQISQAHHPHMTFMPQAPQSRYPSHPSMQGPPVQHVFNMQQLQSSLHSYQIQAQPLNHQPRYGHIISTGSTPYNVSPMQVSTASAQQPQVYGVPLYQQTGAFYEHYSHSPPNAGHGFPITGYGPAYPAPQPSAGQTAPHYVQWPQQGMPFMYIPQYGQQNSMMPLSPPEYNSPQTPPSYGPRRRSLPHLPHAGHEVNEMHLGPQVYDQTSSVSQRPIVVPRHISHSGSRQRRGSPAPSSFTVGRCGSNNVQSLPSTSTTSLTSRSSQSTLHPILPRGPPRKPRQSGHALWVGNLPPGTTVTALKDYFATDQIESVFLISKSNCAFVNYKTESACNEAMGNFHDSRFQGVRLVCRLRRNSSPSGDGLEVDGRTEPASSAQEVFESTTPDTEIEISTSEAECSQKSTDFAVRGGKERYFIVKSLTLEDLDTSVSNGIWATQTHNEPALNDAYKSADNVYLIFSANKSGEYYGYARMVSEISEEVSSKIEWAPMSQEIVDTALPKAIYTPPTSTAPRGRIIDDSSRGTIFWEVIEDSDSEDDAPQTEGTTISKSWGKPFKVEWISTSKVPFYRTRGLRNPYNVSREVKIARDGTELEPSVGKRLLQMFHRGGALPTELENITSESVNKESTSEISQVPEVVLLTPDE